MKTGRRRTDGIRKRRDTGMWFWRRVDPRTGRRVGRSTGTTRKDHALKIAAQFDEEWERERAGLASYDWARRELEPLVLEWLAIQKRELAEKSYDQKVAQINRAVRLLGLRVIADLDDVAALDRKLRRVEARPVTLARCYQKPLKQLSTWLAENHRYTEHDLLANWKRIAYHSSCPRRALTPDEVARAFRASDRLDVLCRRKHALRPVLTALLVTAPRMTALVSRDVGDLLETRIDFGEGVGNKRRGYGALDQTTADELRAYVGKREEGPLFLSATGGRYSKERLLDQWRQAFSLGTVDGLLPDASEEDRYLVHVALLSGKVRVSRGGSRIRAETRRARAALAEKIELFAHAARADWTRAMESVDVHTFRKTHRTWAEAQGIPAVLVDKQLGHALTSKDLDVFKAVRALAGNPIGRKHYLDMDSKLLDPTPCAEAVRGLLDAAEARLCGAGAKLVALSTS